MKNAIGSWEGLIKIVEWYAPYPFYIKVLFVNCLLYQIWRKREYEMVDDNKSSESP